MAILRSLVVNLGLQSASYKQELDKTNKKTKTSFSDMGKSAAKYGAAVASAMGVAAIATSKATVEMVRNQSNMAALANMTINQYTALSFAAQQYGISAEKVSDISKDTLEKVGEYVNAGSGGLQDFADAMNMSKKETLDWARSVDGMSGQQIFQKMVTEMEAAGLSSAQMSNALEALGSDATALIPLFANQGAELTRLTDKYNDFNEELSPEQVARFRATAENIDLMTASIQRMTAQALEPAIAQMEKAFKFWSNIGDFQDINNLSAKLVELHKESKTLQENIAGGTGWFYSDEDLAADQARLEDVLQESRETQEKLMDLRDGPEKTFGELYGGQDAITLPTVRRKTQFETSVDDKDQPVWGAQFGTDQVDTYALNLSKRNEAEAEALAESLALSQETLQEKYDRESTLLEDNLSDYDTYLEAKANLDAQYTAAQKEEADKQARAQYQQAQDLLDFTSSMIGITTDMLAAAGEQNNGFYKALFLAQKAAAIPSMVVSTQQAYTGALAQFPTSPWIAESVRAMGYASIGIAAGQAVAGVFHGGGTIPNEGTYLLDGGETVYTRNQHEELMDSISGGGSGGMAVTVDLRGTTGDKELDRKLKESAQSSYQAVFNDFRTNGAIAKQARK